MKISIPLTGTLISYNPEIGDTSDPVRIINLNLGNVSWQLISLDLVNDLALIEVTPADEGDFSGVRRPLTAVEKQKLLDDVKSLLLNNSVARLYQISGSARLVKPKL